MRILVAGASGGTGQEVIREATSRGGAQQVYAFLRTASKLPTALTSACAGVLVGDAKDESAVKKAFADARPDVLVIAVGSPLSDNSTRTETTRVLLDGLLACEHASVRAAKVVIVSSVGASGSMNQIPFLMRPILGFILRNALKDHTAQEDIAKDKLPAEQWMIVRPVSLLDGPASHAYDISVHGGALRATKVTRADVAHFIVDQITVAKTDESSWGKAVAITR
jgi:nucleoside-diphosphate-sugar epimerase